MRVGKLRKIWTCLVALLVVAGCDVPLTQDDLEALLSRGELVLITRNNSACYYEGPHGPVGFEYDLAKAFADDLGVELRVEIIEEEVDMITALKSR
jgi:membrane-bound lytic murein transglycosylase F